MQIDVRRADLGTDRELLVRTLRQHLLGRHLSSVFDDRRFNWLYRDGPYGSARAWLAFDRVTGQAIGAAAAFPRLIYFGRQKHLGFVLGDFCISDDYRALGPALRLQRACLADVDFEVPALAYDFPSRGMMAVYQRMGVEPVDFTRMARLLRTDTKLATLLGNGPAARILSAVGNLWLQIRDPPRSGRDEFVIEAHSQRCGEEFSKLAEDIGSTLGACVVRSAEYLNWRYFEHPFRNYQLVTARRKGRLVGYAIYTKEDQGAATIVDLLAMNEAALIGGLVGKVVSFLQVAGASSVSMSMLGLHSWIPLFAELGFKRRDTNPVILYMQDGGGRETDFESWFLLAGDRES